MLITTLTTYGDNFSEDHETPEPPRVILIQSLLSSRGPTSADQNLIDEQRKAMAQVPSTIKTSKSSYWVAFHNNATNSFRLVEKSNAQDFAEKDLDELRKIGKQFLDTVINLAASSSSSQHQELISLLESKKALTPQEIQRVTSIIKGLDLTDPQKLSLLTLINTENQFKKLSTTSTPIFQRRNKEEYLIALKKIFVEAMGGAVKNNCKSGKDRTGQSELYQHGLSLVTQEISRQSYRL